MSIDIVYILEAVSGLVTAVIALFGVYRSLTIGKSLVTRVYRSRAYWLSILMIILAVLNLPFPPSSAIGSDIGYYGFFVFLIALLVFIDSNVAVSKEIDFFHNDILHWHRIRVPMFSAVTAGTVIGILASTVSTNSGLYTLAGIGIVAFFVLLGVVFAYAGAAMFVIARRTYDHTMRKFVKMLGFAVLCYVLFVTIWLPLDFIYPNLGDIVTDFILIGTAYFFYQAAMSLSPVGRIQKEI
jgi:hypothetical protein